MTDQLLLRHPRVDIGEGPNAFMLRLAEANQVGVKDLKRVGIGFVTQSLTLNNGGPLDFPDEVTAHALRMRELLFKWPTIWNQSGCRCCPLCLAEGGNWKAEWELLFFDACPVHKCWLVDQCDACNEPLTWGRSQLNRCNCGRRLAQGAVSEAPGAVLRLSEAMACRLYTDALVSDHAPFENLDLQKIIRLVRFLGAYGQTVSERLPQKIREAGSMEVSWQVTSMAAEILADWPKNFHRALHAMLDRSSHYVGQRFPTRFGFFYASLFRQLADQEFEFLRIAFESFVAQHWPAPIAKRNSRLAESLIERGNWVSANMARRKLQISGSRLAELIRSGTLVGEERFSASGRRFLVVKKDSLAAMTSTLNDQVDLLTACKMLGLTKARLSSSLPGLFPEARKVEGKTNHWAISRSSILALLNSCSSPLTANIGTGQVSLDHVLRYWACSDSEAAEVLSAIRAQAIKPIGQLPNKVGLGKLIFFEDEVR